MLSVSALRVGILSDTHGVIDPDVMATMEGLDVIRSRRGDREGPVLLTGPGKVGAALAVDTSWNGHSVCETGGIEVLAGEPAESVATGARIGIDYASDEDRTAPLRFAEAGSKWVSHRHKLDSPR